MDDVPKIVPVWQDVTLQDLLKNKRLSRFTSEKIPDYGGIGVDVTYENGTFKCQSLKSTVNKVHFGAEVCALPFVPLNTVKNMPNPCSEVFRKQGLDFRNFCVKLEGHRASLKVKQHEQYRKKIESISEKLKRGCSKQDFEKLCVPEKILELSRQYPEHTYFPSADFSYAGGCLSSSKLSNMQVVLYPHGKNLDKLTVTPLEEKGNVESSFVPQDSIKRSIKLKGGHILQISSAVDGYCFVRQKNVIHFVDFLNLNALQTDSMNVEGILNIAANPFNPVELLAVFKNGKLKLKDLQTRKVKKIAEKVSNEFFLENSWRCSFGSHPMSALCLSNKSLCIYDLRLKNERKSELFSTSCPSCYINEDLTAMETYNANPFQHFIASHQHLFLCDERYPKNPVMIWNHLLNDYPLFCNNVTYAATGDSSDAVVILGTQESREICSISMRAFSNQVQPTSLTLPMFLSSPSDCVDSLKLQSVFIDDYLSTRFSSSLIGMCVLPLKRCGFTCFQLTSLGDLFFQDFNENLSHESKSNFRIGTGCTISHADKIKPRLSDWININEPKQQKGNTSDHTLGYINVDLKDALNIPNEMSANCVNCRCENLEKDLILSELCPTCGLSEVQSQHLSEAYTSLNLIAGSIAENANVLSYDINSLNKFKDSYSRKILQAWTDIDSMEENADLWDLDPDSRLEAVSPIPHKSYSNISDKDVNASMSHNLSSEMIQNTSHSLYDDFTGTTTFAEELVPSSQNIKPPIGETSFISLKSKLKPQRKSMAGF